MWLIAGLGNPGSQYKETWHNCGFMTLDVLAQRSRIPVSKSKFKGEYGQGTILGEKVVLLRPQTFMNLSGESIREALQYFKIAPENLIVLYDDIDLPRGTIRVRPSGGPGTHNGMKSIILCLGSQDFPGSGSDADLCRSTGTLRILCCPKSGKMTRNRCLQHLSVPLKQRRNI